MLLKIPCAIYRGGTSKAVFFTNNVLPQDPEKRNRILLSILGTSKLKIDGIGGTAMSTSKIVIIGKSTLNDADIEYTHGQVNLEKPFIDYTMNGANIAFAVGIYAVHQKLLSVNEPIAEIKTFNTNTESYIDIIFPVIHEKVYHQKEDRYESIMDIKQDALVELRFNEPQGETTDQLFPTGKHLDILSVNGLDVPVTIIDSGNLSVLIDGASLGLQGDEVNETDYKHVFDELHQIRNKSIELLRSKIPSLRVNFVESGLPKIVIIGRPASFTSKKSHEVDKSQMDIWARDLTFDKLHPSIPASGAVTLGISSLIPGTLTNQFARFENREGDIRIGNPSGIFESKASVTQKREGWAAQTASVFNTAEALLDGYAWVKQHDD